LTYDGVTEVLSTFSLTVTEIASTDSEETSDTEVIEGGESVSELAGTGEFIFFNPNFLLKEKEEELAVVLDKVTQTGKAFLSFNKEIQEI